MFKIVLMGHRYTGVARGFHWIIALLLVCQIALGMLADDASPPRSWHYLDAHAQLGITLFGLMLLRVAWRLGHPPPPLPARTPVWQALLAGSVHGAIYVLVLLLPITGYALWMWDQRMVRLYGLFPLPLVDTSSVAEFWRSLAGYAHEWGFYVLCGLLTLHIGAAAVHELLLRDRLVRERML
ncbi:cytochrome b/b6 domain-containing protein [Altererythrobacter arenosus]|uniref:Cytochrome b/b6 domain-containing protein n=1 Tax=Altererythrobacter arenosus TaxID=3032592 RepID=A0ABY8FRM2_9SPHN|nr:cytochrome b/b6 domain-containing protein [Altererythrobacter sp. CAU 1644]WFL76051.1 cytochrome b/b6 domain-containing protein [Altererythrobacter sp. CAU 1644]